MAMITVTEDRNDYRRAWFDICELLDELSPEWHYRNGGTGREAALTAIRQLASRPSPARVVPRRVTSDYVEGNYGPDDLAAIWNACCEAHKRAALSPAPERVDEGVKVTKAQAREFRRWLNGDVLQVLLDVSNGIDSPGLVSMARSAIRRVESITAAMRNEHE